MITDRSQRKRETKLLLALLPKPKPILWHRSLILWGTGVLMVGLTGSYLTGWFWVQKHLAPLVEIELSNFLNRPVKMGSVESFSLGQVRFGETKILTTPTDSAKVSMKELRVSYDPLKLLVKQKLDIVVTVVEPDIYLEEGTQGNWLLTEFDPVNANHPVALKSLRLKNAKTIVVARGNNGQKNSPVTLQKLSSRTDFINNNQEIKFQVNANLTQGGQFNVSGVAKTTTGNTNLLVRGNGLKVSEVGNLFALPVTLKSGELDTNLEVSLRPNQLPLLRGIGTLHHVTAQVPSLPHTVQTTGELRFKETEINFNQVATNFGAINSIVNGNIDLRKGYDITAQTNPITISNLFKTLNYKPPKVALSGEIKSSLKVTGTLDQPNFNLGVATTKPTQVDRVNFKQINAQLNFNNRDLTINNIQAFPTVGGKINGTGKLSLTVKNAPKFDLNIRGEIPANTLSHLYDVTLPLEIGTTNAEVNLSGIINKPDSVYGQGKADFQMAGGTIQADNFIINRGNWQGTIQAKNVNLNSLNVSLPNQLNQGKLEGTFNVSGQVKAANINNIKADGNAQLILNKGSITANNLQLSQGNWQTNLGIQGVKLKEILPTVPQNFNGNINGNLEVAGKVNDSLDNIKARGQASLDLEKGQIQASDIDLTNGKWSTQLITRDIPITKLFGHSVSALKGTLNSQLNLSGSLIGSLKSIQGQGIAKLALSQGIITAKKITLNQGKFTTILAPQNLDLTKISENFKGKLNGTVAVIGQLDKLNPENLQAKGQLNFSQGISSIRQTLTTNFNWNGQRLTLENIKSLGLLAKGWAEVEKTDKLPQIKGFSLEIAAKGFDLTVLPLNLSSVIPNLNYSGKMDFEGTVTGNPKTPTIEGKLALINLKVGELQFEPVLKGNIAGEPTQGVKLALAGRNDQLNLELAQNWQPMTFNIKQGQQSITGMGQSQEFQVEAKKISLNFLQKLAKTITKKQYNLASSNYLLSQPVSGELSGQFVWDLQTGAITGKQVAIANPVMGTLKAKEFTGNIHYGNGSVTLKNGQLQAKNSQYQLNGQFTPTANGPIINAEVAIDRGNLQDILETLQIFDLDDLKRGFNPPIYGKAADLYGNVSPDSPLVEVGKGVSTENPLTYFKDFTKKWDEEKQKRQKTAPLPELRELQGEFRGKVALKMTPKLGIQTNFDLQGQEWKWGEYKIDQMTAKGDWTKGKLTLEPVSVQVGKSLVGFAGQITEKTQKGELTVQNISLEKISDLLAVPPPLNFGGQLNATLTIGGSRENPQGRGKLVIDQASINETSLNSTQGEFIYSEGKFDFAVNSVLGRRTNPLTLEGTFPYQLPFAKVKPKNNDFALKFQAQNEDLSLLNVLTKGQVAWLGGQGEVQLNVSGKVDPQWGIPYELDTNGIAWVENATIAAKVMPQAPLTKVQGKIFLNLDRVTVEGLTGQFSGGKIAVTGSLPLLQTIPETNPLTIQFDDLALDIPQKYRGGVTGFLNITGSALKPKIGGNVDLFEGEIFLGDEKEENKDKSALLANTEFADLRLTLGENIVVSRLPILTFLATGSLNINGTLKEPHPEGIINLNSGLINLFATQLRLAGGKDNTAQFSSEKGLDPYLNIRLFTAATETSRNRVNINPNSAEINEPFSANADSLQTVRIQAYVKGYASQLTDKVELTSQPQRTPQEIITLLGGNFLNTLATGETTLGLANLAGTAVLGAVQGAIGEALGLNEFRIFPTTLINEKDRVDSSSLGVAAEAGVDLTENLSLSIQKILNADSPPELGIKYRINNSTTIRGSSNFSNDSRGSIQFEQRF